MAHNSYTMCICGLPNMYTLSPRACSPQASGVHIRQTTHAHGNIYIVIELLYPLICPHKIVSQYEFLCFQ